MEFLNKLKKYISRKNLFKISIILTLILSWFFMIFSFFYTTNKNDGITKPEILISELNNSIDNSKYKYNYKQFEKIYIESLINDLEYQELPSDTLIEIYFNFGEKNISIELKINDKKFYYLYELLRN